MACNKYGRIFTQDDVYSIVEHAIEREFEETEDLTLYLEDFKGRFDKDEPLFVLRARDKRAIAAVRNYRDNQNPRAPQNHLDGIEKAMSEFEAFRVKNVDKMKEPD